MRQWLDVRPEDRRNTGAAFLTLFAMMVAHAILETARDALFLASLPASKLPWAYLAIAVLAVLVAAANRHCVELLPRRALLGASLLVAAFVTGGMYTLVEFDTTAALYAFYVWTGLIATVVVVQFWLLLSDVFTVSQAKRVYAVIGAGGLLGATVGSALSGTLLTVLAPRELLLAGAIVFALAAMLPAAIRGANNVDHPRRHPPRDAPRRGGWSLLRAHPYLRRLALLVAMSTVVVTAGDYLFKSVVDARIDTEDLGTFFAQFYAALNGLALLVQLFFASWLLRAAGVNRTLMIMPALLVTAAAVFLLVPGLIPVLVLKAADGALRHSVNRTGSELLYMPLPGELRHRFKAVIDSLGQRGGQAVASCGILVALALGAGTMQIATGVLVLGLAWIIVVASIKAPYLELFREQLRGGVIDARLQLPALDLHQLETLMGALNSSDDSQVVAALDVLAEHGRTHVIPALILYHPSREVVLRALELMTEAHRTDVLPITERLLGHDDNEVRAAALRARTAIAPNHTELRRLLDDRSARVRGTALIGLITTDLMQADEAQRALRAVLDGASHGARRALARAIRFRPTRALDWVLIELGRVADRELRIEVAEAIAASPHLKFLPTLLEMLAVRRVRSAARDAILAIGPPALDFLDGALSDRDLAPAIRRHIPRTISKIATAKAAAILLHHLPTEPDGMTRFKILRGLGRMVTNNPRLPLDRSVLRDVAHGTLARIITVLSWRVAIQQACRGEPERLTRGCELLLSLLREKENNAIERLFRLLDLLNPRESFQIIYHGLRSDDPKTRASSYELLDHLVEPQLRDPLLALVDDVSDQERLAGAVNYYQPARLTYNELLLAMLGDASEAVRAVSAYHIGELGLDEMRDELAAAQPAREGNLRDVVERALSLLTGRRPQEAPHAG